MRTTGIHHNEITILNVEIKVDLFYHGILGILKIDGDIPLFFVANNAGTGTSDTKKRFRDFAWEFKSPCYLIKSGDQTSIRNIFRAIAKKLSEEIIGIVYVDIEEEYNLVSW